LGIRPVADFETLNYQIMNELNTNIEAQNTTETAIGFIPCYRLPFLSLFHADCMEIMKQYPDKYFDLAIVDPPYGLGDRLTNGSSSSPFIKSQAINVKEWDIIPTSEYFSELKRVSKNQIIWGGNYFCDTLNSFRCFIYWDKTIHGNSYSDGELAWTSFDKPSKYYRKNIATITSEGRIHPTQKGIGLYQFCITNFCNVNDKILDTHFGSGSIALAVDKANRLDKMNLHLTACEIDLDYVNASIKRISESIKQGTLSF
jgi:site-specific DNA-methyltransferase (adenine-specific)